MHRDFRDPMADSDGWVYGEDRRQKPIWVTQHRPLTPAQRQLGTSIMWLLFAFAIVFSIFRYLNRHMTMNMTVDAVVFGLFMVVILSHWLGGPLGRLIKYGSVIYVFIYVSPIISVFALAFVQHHLFTIEGSKAMVVSIFAGTYLISAYFLFRWIFPRSYTDY